MRRKASRLAAMMGAGVLCANAWPAAPAAIELDIPAQPIEYALSAFAQQFGLQIVFYTDLASGLRSPRLSGAYTPDAALTKLLEGTPLKAEFLNAHTVAIRDSREAPAAKPTAELHGSSAMRLAQADELSREQGVAPAPVVAEPVRTEEVIVTAQKREERLQDVPVPVTAINAQSLVDTNQLRFQDYYTRIPGLSVTPMDLGGSASITLRGITTGGYTNPAVGIVVDDVPYGSSTYKGLGEGVPDFDPSDLTRIEVLRGPQGTLYGASSVGGLIKFVTLAPSTAALNGRVQVGVSDVRNGDGAGYSARGAVNVPLSDTWALRASGFTRKDPGYVDNPLTGVKGVNEATVNGGRLSTLWQPSAAFSLKLNAMFQEVKGDGPSDIQPALGEFQQAYLRDTGAYDKKARQLSAILAGTLGGVQWTAISGYSINEFSHNFDFTISRSASARTFFGVTGAASNQHYETKKLTQELRFAGSAGEHVDWLLGAFYNEEKSPQTSNILAIDPATGIAAGQLVEFTNPFEFRERAAFANVTWHVTDRFDVQLGGRASYNRQSDETVFVGPLVGGSRITPRQDSKDDAFTYLGTLQYRFSDDVMTYVRLASGYRPGGPNANALLLNVPSSYESDTTESYELGIKAGFLDRALTIDASLYHIDWKDVQLQLIGPVGGQYIANAGEATSDGIELSVEARPARGLLIATSLAWGDAALSEDLPSNAAIAGRDGDRLPNSSRFAGSLSIDQDFTLTEALSAFVGGTLSYVGDRKGIFMTPAAPQRQNLPPYATLALHAGLRRDEWTGNLFINNATDRRGVIQGGIGTFIPSAFQYVQPRTIGVSLARTF